VAVPDPVDIRLLALVAEAGRVAVHDLAARAGMDAREVAARLAALAALGLPLVVGVECDQAALRFALARQGRPAQPRQPGHAARYGAPGGRHSASYPQGPPSGPQPIYQGSPHAGPNPPGGSPPGGSGGPASFGPTGVAQPDSVRQPPGGPAGNRLDPVGTWGPPQTAAWARGDLESSTSTTVRTVPAGGSEPGKRTGVVGDVLYGEGLDGERVSIQLVEVVDPADFLFMAAGYRLQPGERSVVVHTELRNRGTVPFSSLPDLYLVLVDVDGKTVSKAPVSLSSRPPHRIGVQPGETAGGHTVYVLPEATELTSVRWGPRPDDDSRALTWSLQNH
jgi:DNA-binding Lrp family transcriptional regulator